MTSHNPLNKYLLNHTPRLQQKSLSSRKLKRNRSTTRDPHNLQDHIIISNSQQYIRNRPTTRSLKDATPTLRETRMPTLLKVTRRLRHPRQCYDQINIQSHAKAKMMDPSAINILPYIRPIHDTAHLFTVTNIPRNDHDRNNQITILPKRKIQIKYLTKEHHIKPVNLRTTIHTLLLLRPFSHENESFTVKNLRNRRK